MRGREEEGSEVGAEVRTVRSVGFLQGIKASLQS
jgi:hypothetical protein